MENSFKLNKDSKKDKIPKLKSRNMPEIRKEQRLIAICVLFFCLLNFPVLTIVNVELFIGGIPILYVYFLAVWVIMIASIMWIIDRKEKKELDETL